MYGEGVGPWSSMERFSTSFELSLGVAVDIVAPTLCLSCLLLVQLGLTRWKWKYFKSFNIKLTTVDLREG